MNVSLLLVLLLIYLFAAVVAVDAVDSGCCRRSLMISTATCKRSEKTMLKDSDWKMRTRRGNGDETRMMEENLPLVHYHRLPIVES
ncbi:hypothetical protein BDB00DRAFT_860688 [Zychaea mexicana]|uniref:uncharacterized protein n=1 Tax=Zychaea mexicana TaxID=64656 RepID=UPI0022FEE4A1|nr:uncharacterized protein BDB00DRAFT_860688 [Zychaea mexicana]KAI9474335.1 hypothetical protein BDB00DRAFT_860688 [Zychaea mexicana]